MPVLTWGSPGTRLYEAGVDKGVLYVGSNPGVAWNGLISVTEETEGGEATPYYYDGEKYLNVASSEEFKATIEAFTYPVEFGVCEGTSQPFPGMYITHQRRVPFGFSYRTKVGNDTNGTDYAYKIHLVYNALAEPTTRANATIADSLDPNNFSWKITTLAPAITDFRRTAHFIFDSRYSSPTAMSALEGILYGSNEEAARLPPVSELFEIFTSYSTFVVVDNGDGTFTATGPDILVRMINDTTFEIESPTAFYVDDVSYTLSSST